MEYCLGDGDGSAAIWSSELTLDTDDDGALDAIGLDFDGDGRLDALVDTDGDGTADHLVLDVRDTDVQMTDDGSGTWAVGGRGGPVRWFGLDGVESTGGPMVDFDGDGRAEDRLFDADGDGLADRVLVGDDGMGYVDTDADGRWDVRLTDSDGDGAADAASAVEH